MWSRAQVFVAQKTALPINLVSDSVIQTAWSRPGDPALQMTITRKIAADGSGTITLLARCGALSGCLPSVGLAGRQFRDYLIAGR